MVYLIFREIDQHGVVETGHVAYVCVRVVCQHGKENLTNSLVKKKSTKSDFENHLKKAIGILQGAYSETNIY